MSTISPYENNSTTGVARSSSYLPEDGPAAPPRSNGELIFAEPWEGRVFGVTLALVESGAISWSEFQSELVAEIQSWEAAQAVPAVAQYRYYARWLAAFEKLLDWKGLCPETVRVAKAHELLQRPHGHDH